MTFFASYSIDEYDVGPGTKLAVVPMAYEPDLFYVLDDETGIEDVEEFTGERRSVAFTVTVDDVLWTYGGGARTLRRGPVSRKRSVQVTDQARSRVAV